MKLLVNCFDTTVYMTHVYVHRLYIRNCLENYALLCFPTECRDHGKRGIHFTRRS